jgi:hypothetical protein
MEKVFLKHAPMGISIMAAFALAGCGTPAAKDFGGAWRPVNRFQSAPTEIPLLQPYTYFAAPMDGTLKTMLTRWSKDSGMALSYQLHSDFTLYTPVARIHTPNVQEAASQLNSIYASEGVSVTVNERRIAVEQARAIAPALVTGSAPKPVSTGSR